MKPILFNTEMVRAILDGRKTVTRRLVKISGWKITGLPTQSTLGGVSASGVCFNVASIEKNTATREIAYPPYKKDDILYVRETFAQPYGKGFFYAADYQDGDIVPADCGDVSVSKNLIKWRPSIHMPKEAARIFLRVTNVRVERLQEMTDDDAKAEGANWENGKNVGISEKMRRSALERFTEIWDSTIKKSDLDLYGWDANPYVWVIAFERCEKPKGE